MLPAADPHQRLAASLAVDRALELDEERWTRRRADVVHDLLTGLVEIWNQAHTPTGATDG